MRERLTEKATRVLGSSKAAKRWMIEPAIGLNRQRPVDLISTEDGRQLVETYLDQMEYAVYV